MKYLIETAEIRNRENERDETIYQGPFTFNVCRMYVRFLRVRFQCPRPAKKNVCAMGKSVAAESLAVFVAVRLTRFRSQTRGPSTTRFLLIYAYARRQQATYS